MQQARLLKREDVVKRLVLFLLLLVPAAAGAQPKATESDRVESVEVDPIRCWWRTSAGAVRLGEPFDLSLTCAVLETAAVQVVPDESRLGNGVIAMAPFEVVTGTHPADLHSGARRFFQYLYTLRLINADAIGRDVRIPDVQIHYRVNSKVAANTALQGRDLVYVMPPISVRIASLVPADAADIRDAAGEPFTAAEALDFRASVLEILGIGLVALGALMTLLVLVRVARGSRRRTPAEQRQIGTAGIISVAARELSDVQREREQQGWTPALIDRAISAARLVAAAALGRPISQRTSTVPAEAGEGRLIAPGPRRGTSRVVSAAVTPADLTRHIARLPAGSPRAAMLEALRSALETFTVAGYGRDAGDQTKLDAALSAALDAVREVKTEYSWPRRILRRPGTAAAVETHA
jgi:hypothetical protein